MSATMQDCLVVALRQLLARGEVAQAATAATHWDQPWPALLRPDEVVTLRAAGYVPREERVYAPVTKNPAAAAFGPRARVSRRRQ